MSELLCQREQHLWEKGLARRAISFAGGAVRGHIIRAEKSVAAAGMGKQLR